MKLLILFNLSLMLFGCVQTETESTLNTLPAPPPPPRAIPVTAPPQYVPKFNYIQVHTIPRPLDSEGKLPFAVWVDGKPLNAK